MQTDTLTDYSAQIRAEIECEVVKLKSEVKARYKQGDWTAIEDINAQHVEIGYIINSHHGQPLFVDGESISSLPVKISHHLPRTIKVSAGWVRHEREHWFIDENGKDDYEMETDDKAVEAEVTW